MNRYVAREFEARLPLFREASIPEYYIVARACGILEVPPSGDWQGFEKLTSK